METDASVALMIMYEDESVDVRYVNGCQLQLSPCGCEFVLVKAMEPSRHPLQPRERVRQRTRFTISTYKELLVAALAFRNKHARRPYLPAELIPAEHRQPFFSIDTEVQWPCWSSCEAELGPGGETVIRSVDGRAALMLSPSGEEFSVEFTCSLSQTDNRQSSVQCLSRDPDVRSGSQQVNSLSSQTTSDKTKEVHQGTGTGRELKRSRSCSPRITSTSQPKSGEMYQSTTVVQHHSCSAYASTWCYPLSLARHHWTACLSKVAETEGAGESAQKYREMNMSEVSSEERRSHLPQALPLTCPSPHRHRWKIDVPLSKEDQPDNLPTELVKVMWCQGVTYRILSGAVSVIDISPGDGSVIRSNGVLNTYFTHHQPELRSGQVKELSYHLNSLPPDVCGQVYSICSIVSRASRILTCYNQMKQSLKLPATPSCLQEANEGRYLSKASILEECLSNPAPVEHVRSDLVAAELEKIKRFNFLLENSCLHRSETGCAELQDTSAREETLEPVNESSIAEALQRTSRAIQDIDALVSATTLM
ncbi:hypothetical protein INR49_025684 [Caranx melampygus]|nr:hypothetical protein INR49_025684 [Caranx melampygus]